MLSLSLLVLQLPLVAAAANGGSAALLSLRTVRQIQSPPWSPTNPDPGAQNVRAAADIAWKSAGEASEARAATSKLRSNINRIGAGQHSDVAAEQGNAGTQIYAPQAAASEAAAQASLKQALAYEAQVKAVLAQVDAEAYKSAQIAANKEVTKLEAEAKQYYQSLLAKFKALADPGPPTAAQAAAKAAQPYIDVELRVGALVQYYNEKAIQCITDAQSSVFQAKGIALTAQTEQSVGTVDMAQRHMMQAHMLIGAANLKKQEAFKIRKLAESLNMSIPSYQRAAQMAAAHALATFTGLQMGDKAHMEMRSEVAKSTKQMEDGFAALDAAMAQAQKAVAVVTPSDI